MKTFTFFDLSYLTNLPKQWTENITNSCFQLSMNVFSFFIFAQTTYAYDKTYVFQIHVFQFSFSSVSLELIYLYFKRFVNFYAQLKSK